MSDVVWANAERFSDVVSFRRQVDGTWLDVTAKEFAAQVLAIAKGLVKAGIGRGDRVGLMSKTRYEWNLIDFAIWAAGGVTVPIYETSSPEQVRWILSDSGAKAVFVETSSHLAAVDEVRDRLDALRYVWAIENEAVVALTALTARVTLGHTPDVQNLVADLGTFRPTFVVAVPRVFEKVYNTAKQRAHSEGKGPIFDLAEQVAVAYSEAKDTGGASLLL